MTAEPKPTPQDRVNKLIADLFPKVLAAPNLNPLTSHKLTPTPAHQVRQEMFLESVEAGWSEAKSRKAVQVSQAVLDYWKTDPEFIKRLVDATRVATDYLRDLAFLRAHDSDTVLMRLLEAREPETFKPKAGGGSGQVNVIIQNLYQQDEELDNPQIIIQHEEDHATSPERD